MGTKRAKRLKITLTPLAEIERDEIPTTKGPLHGLFTATQRRMLGFLFGEPERSFHLRELMALTGGGAGANHRELHRLLDAGLVYALQERGRIFVRADPQSPIHAELVAMVQKTVGLVEPLRQAFAHLARDVRLGFVHESRAQPSRDDRPFLDVVLVAKERRPSDQAIRYAIEQAESRFGRAPWVLSLEPKQLRAPDEHLTQVLMRPRLWLFGNEARLAELARR